MLINQTLLRTWRPRSRTRKASQPISKDSSLMERNSRTAAMFLTTTFSTITPSTWSSNSVKVFRSSSRPFLARRSLSTSSHQTLLQTWKPRFKRRKASRPNGKGWSLQARVLKTAELFLTTTYRGSPPVTWSSHYLEVFFVKLWRSLSGLLLKGLLP